MERTNIFIVFCPFLNTGMSVLEAILSWTDTRHSADRLILKFLSERILEKLLYPAMTVLSFHVTTQTLSHFFSVSCG